MTYSTVITDVDKRALSLQDLGKISHQPMVLKDPEIPAL